jgi:hypothetical protein
MRVLTFAIVIVTVAISILTGCTRRPPVLTTNEIVSRVISAMDQVKTYRLDSTVTDNRTVVDTNFSSSQIWIRQDQALIDLADNTTWFCYNISKSAGHETPYIGQDYFIGEWNYSFQSSPINYMRDQTDPDITWFKKRIQDPKSLFSNIRQITPQIELLKTATEVESIGKETVDGHQCYILEIVPTANATIDWIFSQYKDTGGPRLNWFKLPYERSREIYMKAYVDGSTKFWIDCDSFYIRQVSVNLHFVVKPGNVKYSETGLEIGDNTSELDLPFEEIISDFRGHLHFSDYGQRLSITPPQDALVTPVS